MSGIKRTLAFEVDLKSDLLRGVKRLRLRCVGFTPPVGETSADKVDSDSDDGSDSDRVDLTSFLSPTIPSKYLRCVGFAPPVGETSADTVDNASDDGSDSDRELCCNFCGGTEGVGVPDCFCGDFAGYVCEYCDVDGPTYPNWCTCGFCDVRLFDGEEV